MIDDSKIEIESIFQMKAWGIVEALDQLTANQIAKCICDTSGGIVEAQITAIVEHH
jgi:hypothetical protein